MNIINLELSKRLAPYLEGVETEEVYEGTNNCFIDNKPIIIKALNLEEAIEFIGKNMCQMELLYPNGGGWGLHIVMEDKVLEDETLIGVFGKFIEYLLDNNLLGKT